jgi:hypothetical protein
MLFLSLLWRPLYSKFLHNKIFRKCSNLLPNLQIRFKISLINMIFLGLFQSLEQELNIDLLNQLLKMEDSPTMQAIRSSTSSCTYLWLIEGFWWHHSTTWRLCVHHHANKTWINTPKSLNRLWSYLSKYIQSQNSEKSELQIINPQIALNYYELYI